MTPLLLACIPPALVLGVALLARRPGRRGTREEGGHDPW